LASPQGEKATQARDEQPDYGHAAISLGPLRPSRLSKSTTGYFPGAPISQFLCNPRLRHSVVDTFSRYLSVLDARFSYRAEDVITPLDRVRRRTGYLKPIRVDQGSALTSRNMALSLSARGHARLLAVFVVQG